MQSNRFCLSWSTASPPLPHRRDLDVAVADQLDQRAALHVVVFDDEQASSSCGR